MVDRFNFEFQYHDTDPPPCTCNVKKAAKGYYVKYEDYKELEDQYFEDMRRARKNPHDFSLKDATQRTMLQSEMNKRMSWIIQLAQRIGSVATYQDMLDLREYFAKTIDTGGRK